MKKSVIEIAKETKDLVPDKYDLKISSLEELRTIDRNDGLLATIEAAFYYGYSMGLKSRSDSVKEGK